MTKFQKWITDQQLPGIHGGWLWCKTTTPGIPAVMELMELFRILTMVVDRQTYIYGRTVQLHTHTHRIKWQITIELVDCINVNILVVQNVTIGGTYKKESLYYFLQLHVTIIISIKMSIKNKEKTNDGEENSCKK